ncbi:MAG: hypothetical protein LUP01_03535, partial [Methanothrix sp.]|nr:hypothetical protein [Methanothrix sp.]
AIQMIADPGLWGLGRSTFTLESVAFAFALALLPRDTAGAVEADDSGASDPSPVPRFWFLLT